MNTRIAAFLLAPLLLLTLISNASAQVQRTFVSGLGSDSSPCSRTAPCRTFTQALMGTNAGGEVVVLDSAGYGAFTITQAVSIIAPPGVYAGISVFSGDGIDINASSGDTVILRGLNVNNQGSTGSGIAFNTGGTLHIENCVVNGFSAKVNASAGVVSFGFGHIEVKDSIIRGNFNGIQASTVFAIDQVRLEGNSNVGLFAVEGSKVTVRNSIASGNATGFHARSNSLGSSEMDIENCVASNNGNGIVSESTGGAVATVRVSNSIVTSNGTGLLNNGAPALLLSRGNNTVEGNTTNTSGTIGSYSAK